MSPGFRSDKDHNEEVQMNCDKIWDLLSAYVDGETTPQETALVERHTAECEACASDLAFLRSSSVVLHETAEVEPPVNLRQAILAATVNRQTWRERLLTAARAAFAPTALRYGGLAVAGAAAAVAFLALQDTTLPPVDERVVYAPKPHGAPTQIVPNGIRPPDRTPTTNIVQSAKGARPLKVAAVRRRAEARSVSTQVAKLERTVAESIRPTRRSEPVAPKIETHPFKAKVGDALGGEVPPVTEPEPVIVRRDPEYENGLVRPMDPTNGITPQPSQAPVKPTRILLAASSGALEASQLASLADLKRELSRSQIGLDSRELRQRLRDHQIRIDVIKGSF